MQPITQGTLGSMTQEINSIVQSSALEDQSAIVLEALTGIFISIENASLNLDVGVSYIS